MTTTRALTNRQIANAAAVVLVGFLASGVLGLVRQAVISATFGTSHASDAFLTAQRIPELIFALVAGGALGSSFIPVFARYLKASDEAGAWRLASAVITLSSLAAAALSMAVAVFARPLVVLILAAGKPPEVQELTVNLTRIMMLTPFVFSISGLLMGILQTFGSFLLPSLATSMNSVGLIVGALLFAYWIPAQPGSAAQVEGANVYGLAWGAVFSALLHLGVQIPGLRKITRAPEIMPTGTPILQPELTAPLPHTRRIWDIRALRNTLLPVRRGRPQANPRLILLPDPRVPGLREVLLLMGPRVLGLGVAQLNFIVNASLSSPMVDGSYTALTTAWMLMFFALGVIGQSVGTAVFPTLAALAAENDMAGYKNRLAAALRSVLFLAIPATVGLILLGRPLVALIFERQQWTPESTSATAWALAFFALGITGHAGLEVLSRAFYALSDTWTPVRIGVASLLSNIILSFVFIQFIGQPGSLERGPFAGLALANSLTTLLEALALWLLLRRRIGSINDGYVWNGVWRTLAASALMGLAIVLVSTAQMSPSLMALVGVPLAAATFGAAALALGLDEVRSVVGALLRKVRR